MLLTAIPSLLLAVPSGVEVLVLGPTNGSHAPEYGPRLALRLPGGPVHFPVARSRGGCRTSTRALASTLQEAYRHRRTLERHQVRLTPARIEAGLARGLQSNQACRSPNAWLARILDEAADGRIRAFAKDLPPESRADQILEALRPRPLAYAWADLLMPPSDRQTRSAWTVARADPDRLMTWMRGAELVARSWSERTATPETRKDWVWPWLTVALFGGVPLAILAWILPRVGQPTVAVAHGTIGLAVWGTLFARGQVPGVDAFVFLPVSLLLLPSSIRSGPAGAVRKSLALLTAAVLAAAALNGLGSALAVLPVALAFCGSSRTE